jgi:ferredoxin
VGAIERGVVRHEDCQFCFACVDKCPHGALTVVDTWASSALPSHAPERAAAPDQQEAP